jgi:uncharacterized membrane protein
MNHTSPNQIANLQTACLAGLIPWQSREACSQLDYAISSRTVSRSEPMDSQLPRRVAANPTEYNIDAIAKLEHDALGRRTLTERVSDIITKLVGNIGFLVGQLLLISGWCLANLHVIPGLKPFDPFPFGVLALIVSSESVFLTIFVLISQSRMARQSERRSHLDLQVGMLSEQELTTILRMLQKLCQHMGVNVDSSKQEVQSFSKTTDVHKLASQLEDKLPED